MDGPSSPLPRMNRHHILILLLAIALGVAAYLYLPPAGEESEHLAPPDPAPAAEPAPEIRYPVPAPPAPGEVAPPEPTAAPEPHEPVPPPGIEEAPAEPPLPSLEDSDAEASRSLIEVFRVEGLADWLRSDALVRHLVATIDNLPRERLSEKMRPVQPAQGVFLVEEDGDRYRISPDNHRRYVPYVALAETVDLDRLVDWYIRHYPLFQEAYLDLGYPQGYFNDRLVDVIDHLLATPDVEGPVWLERPHVLYRFADPALESLSAGQKLLIRMGPDQAGRIRNLLRGLRARLTGFAPPP